MPAWEDPVELVRLIRTVDLITRTRVTGQKSGVHISLFKGQGIEFSEIREYVPGDDIRAIDWKVTARYGVPHVKEFTEERDQTFFFVIDLSGSHAFGSTVSKYRMMLEIFASLVFAAVRYHDRVGLLIVTDRVERFIPARSGRSHAVHLIHEVMNHTPLSSGSDIRPALHEILTRLRRMASVMIISDFCMPDFSRELSLLKQHHEVFAIRVTDPRESELPDVGLIELEDAETGEQILADTSDEFFREEFRQAVSEADQQICTRFRRCHVPMEQIRT
ncbi:MAG: DUF58 domain-containing protein, partial [Methanomicrobiales archaeon HGW-Methanomicrobiales-4]